MEFNKIYKILTKNDTGETKSHQSGITIPKIVAETDIFPQLSKEILNPREEVVFYDENGDLWKFQYIYYNDCYHGKPAKLAHNEHRLTCTKDYIRKNSLVAGDSIWFGLDETNVRRIGFVKSESKKLDEKVIIKLKADWHYIKL